MLAGLRGDIMPLVSAVCTQCGAVLQVDSARDAAICQHCGAAFVVDKAINNYNVRNYINADTVNLLGQKDFVIRAGVLEKYQGEAIDVVVPDGVIAIGEQAFKDCRGLRSVRLPQGLETIHLAAFSGCIHLRSINLPESLTCIGSFAFLGCAELQRLELPTGLTGFGYQVFSSSGLTEITIPVGIRTIFERTFANDKLRKVTFLGHPTLNEDAFLGCPLEMVIGRDPFEKEDEKAFAGCVKILPLIYRQQNRCANCGGTFQGRFFPKCRACGKRKDY